MKYEIGENHCLLVFLEAADVRRLHLNVQAGIREDENSRKILQSVYREAALHTGFVPPAFITRIIELLPFEDGSVLLCFRFERAKPKMKVYARVRRQSKVYEFSCPQHLEAFLECAGNLNELPLEVFEQAGKYRFILSNQTPALEQMLHEFAVNLRPALSSAVTREYWRKVY